jgi:hypothetical protein
MSSLLPGPVKVPFWVFAVFGMAVAGVFIADRADENRAAREVRQAVDNATGARVNGEEVSDPAMLLASLQLLEHVSPHHSSPQAAIQIDLLRGSTSTRIIIARDSKEPAEFWMFLPGPNRHNQKLGQEAGRITSADLDGFLRERGL